MNRYLSLIKFSHTVFALPFALIGFFLATTERGSGVDWKLFALVLVCMVTARSAAMAFNRWADRRFDGQNPRTAIREIPAGAILPQRALAFVVLNALAFVAATWLINPLCFALSPVALAVVLGYSYTKRFTALCHWVLGAGLALAPIGAYVAVTGQFAALPWIFSALVFTWVSGFDIIYALQDEEFDRSQGLHSVPVLLGKSGALRLSEALHLLCALSVAFAGWWGVFGAGYWTGAAAFTALLIYQHTLVKPDDLSRVNLAFFTANGVGSVVFGCFVLADLYWCR
jgi:4-hydroxybenzoate polyprenyltransferase